MKTSYLRLSTLKCHFLTIVKLTGFVLIPPFFFKEEVSLIWIEQYTGSL